MNNNLHFKAASTIYNKITDGTHDSPKQKKKGKPLITSKHIKGRNIDFNSAYLISIEDFSKINERSQVEQWDVIVSMIGEYCGFCYIEHNSKIDYAVKNVGLYKAGSKIEAEWLYYYLTSPIGKQYLNSVKSGSSQPYLTLGALRSLPILHTDNKLVKQQITKTLSDLDSKIELNNKINQELDVIAKTLYDYWFVQFDFPNEQGLPYKASGGKMVYNKELKREIPEGWKVEKISKCCSIIDCLHSKKPDCNFENDNYFLLQLENLKDDGLIDLSKKYFVTVQDYNKWTSRIKVKEHDIVITNAGRVGATAQIPKNVTTGIGRNITAIRPTSIAPTYLFLSFRGLDMKRQITWNTDQGAFFTSLNVKGIKQLFVARPSNSIEEKFEHIVFPFRRKRELIQNENQKLTDLRDWLLPMLMNGQVTVGEAEEKLNMAAEPSGEYKS